MLLVKPRRVDDVVHRGRVIVESYGPRAGKGLAGSADYVAWNAHPDRSIAAQVNEPQRPRAGDRRHPSRPKVGLVDWEVADSAIAVVAQDRLQEAYLQRRSEIEDTESVLLDAAARVTEPARRLAEP